MILNACRPLDVPTFEVYEKIAKKYKTTPSRVERAIRYIVNELNSKIRKYFKIKTKKITNGLFFTTIYKMLRGDD